MEQKELEIRYLRDVKIGNCQDIYYEMRDIKNWDKEVFVLFCLDTANRIISREIISIGILGSCLIHPREVFRTAISRNANAIIVAHNHPSGQVQPSEEDKNITEQLKKAGEILGIKLLDHVIVARESHYSFVENSWA